MRLVLAVVVLHLTMSSAGTCKTICICKVLANRGPELYIFAQVIRNFGIDFETYQLVLLGLLFCEKVSCMN